MAGTGPKTGPKRFLLGTERGIALISVLWVLTLLAVITASFATTSRTEVNLARNLIENGQAEALAEAGIQRAIVGLLTPAEQGGLRSDGSLYHWRFGDGLVRFTVVDEGGKVDLNGAQEDLLSALLGELGLELDERGRAGRGDRRFPRSERPSPPVWCRGPRLQRRGSGPRRQGCALRGHRRAAASVGHDAGALPAAGTFGDGPHRPAHAPPRDRARRGAKGLEAVG